MIRQVMQLPSWRWKITIFYDATPADSREILREMMRLGARVELLEKARNNLLSGDLDNGLTYSSGSRHESIMVIGRASSAAEFWNTFDHEKGHVSTHIAEARGIDPYSEQRQYLSGEIARRSFGTARRFICRQCIA